MEGAGVGMDLEIVDLGAGRRVTAPPAIHLDREVEGRVARQDDGPHAGSVEIERSTIGCGDPERASAVVDPRRAAVPRLPGDPPGRAADPPHPPIPPIPPDCDPRTCPQI